jgi:cellulose synthase/poly-beta-1,6-N-acetylglucosamine synthase-like glycosyltransferase
MIAALLLFWLPTAVLAWVYAGYPLTAAAVARVRPVRLRPDGGEPELVTVGIAIHDAADDIEARVADVLAQEVPFRVEVVIASDGSTDGSVELIQRLVAGDSRIQALELPRVGQSAAQSAIFDIAGGDVVVLTDAETRFGPDCLATLVAPFTDHRVGCTTGRLVWLDTATTATARTEGAYWRYEQLVRRLESRAGWLTTVTGAVLAVRRDIYRRVAPHASMDQLLPLLARDQRRIVLAVPEAIASERVVASVGEQFTSRARVATQGITANVSMVGRLAPWRRPTAALAIWSHKLLRWATPLLAGAAGMGALWLVAVGAQLYLVPLAVGVAGLVLATIGWALRSSGRPQLRITSLPLAVVVVNLAFLRGWVNVLRGRRIEAWQRADVDGEDRGQSTRSAPAK